MKAIKKVNDQFYTDIVEESIPFDMLNIKCDAYSLMNDLSGYVDAVKSVINKMECDDVNDILATFLINERQEKDVNIPVLTCHLSGTKQWSEDQIKEFEKAIGSEKEDMAALRKLIEKYPAKSFEVFSSIMGAKLEDEKF